MVTVHDLVNRAQHGAHDVGSSVVNTLDGRRIALIEVTAALLRQARHLVDVVRRMEQRQFVHGRGTRMSEFDHAVQARSHEFGVENVMPVGAERVRIAETIGGDLPALVNQHRCAHPLHPNSCLRGSIPRIGSGRVALSSHCPAQQCLPLSLDCVGTGRGRQPNTPRIADSRLSLLGYGFGCLSRPALDSKEVAASRRCLPTVAQDTPESIAAGV